MNARAPLIALKDVKLQDGAKPLFDGVDLALEPRTRACLVGKNGAGKSTLLKICAGWIEPDAGVRHINAATKIAYVPQEPHPVGETLLDWATSGGAESYTAESELYAFDLEPSKSTKGLSGGELRRAALAKAFAEDPELLLLDEPTNHLDIFAIETLEARIKQSRASVLVISHDRTFLERTTQKCFWLQSRMVRSLDMGFAGFEVWAEKLMAEEAEQLRRLEKAIERETYTFYRSITAQRTRNEGRARNLEKMRQDRADRVKDLPKTMEMAIDSGGTSGKLVAELKGVSKAFGQKTILKGFSTRILRGDRVAIVGPNGAGKSTLVKMMLGTEGADAGEIKLGTNLEMAYLDQTRDTLKGEETLWDALTPLGGDQIMVRGTPKHVAAYAKEFLFRDAQLRQPVSTLSGGERNRLQLARALAKPANLLVLDEPTNDLDMDTLDLLEDVLANYDGTLILVSHDRDFINRLATSTIAMNGRGDVAETPGGWNDFLDQNPGFFHPEEKEAAKPKATAPKVEAPKKQVKLSYKDQRRLEELDTLMPKWTQEIKTLETVLEDPNLYAKDPKKFDATMKALDKLRTDLENGEMEWLELEEKKAELGA